MAIPMITQKLAKHMTMGARWWWCQLGKGGGEEDGGQGEKEKEGKNIILTSMTLMVNTFLNESPKDEDLVD